MKSELAVLREEYFRLGVSTELADRPRAEAAITSAYAQVGRPAPQFLWKDSPGAAMDALAARGADAPDLGTIFWPAFGYPFWHRLREAARAGPAVGAAAEWEVTRPLKNQLAPMVNAALTAAGCGDRHTSVLPLWHGQFDLAWPAGARAAHRLGALLLLQDAETLEMLDQIGRSAAWWWPRDGLCVVCERPAALHLEAVARPTGTIFRLHDDAGPALRFRDGEVVHALHGIRVPDFVVERPEAITVSVVRAEADSEVRWAMIERYHWGMEPSGPAAFLREAGAVRVDRAEMGTLWRLELGGDEPVMVIERAIAPRGSWQRVPSEIRDARTAATWIQDWSHDL